MKGIQLIFKLTLSFFLLSFFVVEKSPAQNFQFGLKGGLSLPNLICWASCCIPCIRQIPFEKELEKKYKGKINFIYLSFDKNINDWIQKVQP